jgi:hypothetical protein
LVLAPFLVFVQQVGLFFGEDFVGEIFFELQTLDELSQVQLLGWGVFHEIVVVVG